MSEPRQQTDFRGSAFDGVQGARPLGFLCPRVWNAAKDAGRSVAYSHSIVPGGFEVMSYVTRLIPRTSPTMRPATRLRKLMSNG